MKVIVFGGTGWVGHRIALELAAHGHQVTVSARGHKADFNDEIAKLNKLYADKECEADISEIFARSRYEAVIDAAPTVRSLTLIGKYAKHLFRYLHCSSTEQYAPQTIFPTAETAPFTGCPLGYDPDGKIACDTLALQFAAEGFPVTILRAAAILGAGAPPFDLLGRRGEQFIRNLKAGKSIELVGSGNNLVQPVEIGDLATAFRLALETPEARNEIFNIGCEDAVTVRGYLDIAAATLGVTAVPKQIPPDRAPIDVNELRLRLSHRFASIDRAIKKLNFTPRHRAESVIQLVVRIVSCQR